MNTAIDRNTMPTIATGSIPEPLITFGIQGLGLGSGFLCYYFLF
jgi:hypothetical protein